MRRIKISSDFNCDWYSTDSECYFSNYDSLGVHTLVITTDELPGKEIRLEIEWLPDYPSEFVIYTLDGTNTGLTLSHYKNDIYTSLITIPEGEGDFKFYFKGPEPHADLYVYATSGLTADLSQETSRYKVAAYVYGDFNRPLVIPAEFRGNTYMFRFEPRGSLLEISHEGYERPVLFEWVEWFEDLGGYEVNAGYFYPFDSYYDNLRLDSSISREDLIYSVEPGDIEGVQIYDDGVSISDDYSGPETLTIRVTTAELMEKGISLTTELRISAAYPAELAFVSGDERIGDLTLYPTEEYGVFANTITIPEGEGDFSFRFSDATLSYMYSFCSDETVDLSAGFYKGYIRPGNWAEMTIPARYRGRTFVFKLNCPEQQISIYEEGVDPETITVEFAEDFPEFKTAGTEQLLYFTIKGADITNINCFIDNNDNAELNYGWNRPSIENGTASFVVSISSHERRSGSFTIHIGKYINGEFREYFLHTMEVRVVDIESISAPESIVIREGEFANVAYDVFPATNSFDTYRNVENQEIVELIDYGRNSFYILGKQAGTTKARIVATNWNEYNQEMAVIAITVLPKETSVGEHIFHANLAVGNEMKLNVSAHNSRAFAEGVTWTSSNPEVATVDDEGNVKSVDNGVAVITADCGEHQVYMGIISGEGYTGVDTPDTDEIRAYGRDGILYIVGAPEGADIRVFDAAGKTRAAKKASGITQKMNVGRGIHVVSVGGKMFKLAI